MSLQAHLKTVGCFILACLFISFIGLLSFGMGYLLLCIPFISHLYTQNNQITISSYFCLGGSFILIISLLSLVYKLIYDDFN